MGASFFALTPTSPQRGRGSAQMFQARFKISRTGAEAWNQNATGAKCFGAA
jgi:hypothetical protein